MEAGDSCEQLRTQKGIKSLTAKEINSGRTYLCLSILQQAAIMDVEVYPFKSFISNGLCAIYHPPVDFFLAC
jgi:hypothetical protein